MKASRSALGKLGDPHESLRIVHVAGTNGKGSVCAMIAASLRRAGLRVGVYNSPHVRHWSDAVTVDGRSDPLGWASSVGAVAKAVGGADGARGKLTAFEVATTAMWVQLGVLSPLSPLPPFVFQFSHFFPPPSGGERGASLSHTPASFLLLAFFSFLLSLLHSGSSRS